MDASDFQAWRSKNAKTQEEVANLLGVTRQTVQNWERGTTPVPKAVEEFLPTLSHRIRQEDPHYGPVTLIYFDLPVALPMQGPRRAPSTMQQEVYATNAAALARVARLSGSTGFENPMVLNLSSEPLWNAVELRGALMANNWSAPTLQNLLRKLADHIGKQTSGFVRTGYDSYTPEDINELARRAQALSKEIFQIAEDNLSAYRSHDRIDEILSEYRGLGKVPSDTLVSAISHAFYGYLGA